jgi:hypothetical protein
MDSYLFLGVKALSRANSFDFEIDFYFALLDLALDCYKLLF